MLREAACTEKVAVLLSHDYHVLSVTERGPWYSGGGESDPLLLQ